jgi:hypothetical protein
MGWESQFRSVEGWPTNFLPWIPTVSFLFPYVLRFSAVTLVLSLPICRLRK